ncbi:MAG: insulinase family protein, partial [Eubacterium sp.]
DFVEKMPEARECEDIPAAIHCEDVQQNEGFKTAGQVQYVARSGNFMERGIPYHGSFRVVRAMLSYGFLWNEVRVKGGAYGVMCGFSSSGEGYFVSYRDPKLLETNEVYKKVAEYLRTYEADEREMTKSIIGTISGEDTPLTPKAKGSRSMSAYFANVVFDEIQKERDEILAASVEEIRRAADMIEAVLADGKICVLGNEEKVKENAELFGSIETL